VAPGGEAGHEPVARSGAEAGADVEAGGDAVEEDAAEQERDAGPGAVRLVEGVDHQLEDDAEDDDVAEGAQAGLLAQGDPEEQQRGADEADPDAGADGGVVGEALVEDVPRHVAQAREQDERGAEAVEDEAGVELDEAAYHGSMLAANGPL
jgi:hypothetical protein